MNQYLVADARRLTEVVRSPVDLVITSPPYFDMKNYGTSNQIGHGQSYEGYLADMQAVFSECHQVVKQSGSMWLIVDTLKRNGDIRLLPFDLANAATNSGWMLKEIVIWEKDRTLPFCGKGEMRNIFEYVLFFVHHNEFKYYPDRVASLEVKPWWVKYPERYSAKGKVPTDIWRFPIPVQGSWGKHYVRHFCPLPEELVLRIIDLCSDEKDLVLDPFAGSGAVLAAAYRADRQFVGLDLSHEFKAMFDAYLPELDKLDGKRVDSAKRDVFAGTIRKLRLLKLPSALLRMLRKEQPESFVNLHGVLVSPTDKTCREPHKLWHVEYTLFVSDAFSTQALHYIRELLGKRPLSKYGIEASLHVKKKDLPIGHEDLWEYRWDATYLPPSHFEARQRPFMAATFRLDSDEEKLVRDFL